MRKLWVSLLAWTLLAASAIGQAHAISDTQVSWSNNSGAGTPVLTATVHYPAITAANNAPVLPTTTGYPVVVFLHGWGRLGSDYYRIGRELASLGVVAVMLNTAQNSYAVMEHDTRAMFKALRNANIEDGGFFEGAMDMTRVGLLGHSMGTAVMALVLNEAPGATSTNPGYRCALGLAPVNPTIALTGIEVSVPVGLVSGQGDVLAPPLGHAIPYYNSLTPSTGLKFHYRMNGNCTHMNLVGLDQTDPVVFGRAKKIVKGFFSQFLCDSLSGLEGVIGIEGVSDPNLMGLDVETVVPQLWAESNLRVGRSARLSVAAEVGFAGLVVSNSMGLPTPTFIGTLLVNPIGAFSIGQTFIPGERLDVILSIPPTSDLVGMELAVQGAGATINNIFLLGSAIRLKVGS